ncbi:MAG: dUTP diphosphatase [Candidatus Dojkabacteria bacterium]
MAKSIKEVTDIIVKFSEARGWKNEDPVDLINALYIELAELSEHYQWKHNFEDLDEDKKIEIGFEFVDIIFYLFRMAHNAGIDIEKFFDMKLPRLEEKFPIGGNPRKAHDEYRKSGKNKKYE